MTVGVSTPKLRRSKQRDSIYKYLCQSTAHPSAEIIYENLRPELPNLSLGTVYRNLTLLEQLGQVQKVTALGNTERYDARLDAHGHFVCTQCGAIEDLAPMDGQALRQLAGLAPSQQIHRTDITFHGLCQSCSKDK